MKAIVIKENGGIENLIYTEIAKPDVKPNGVLIEVKAISINPVDAFVRQYRQALDTYLKPEGDADSFVIGWDVSGVVTATGKDVKDFKTGDAVFGLINFPGEGRGYAEYVAAPAGDLVLKPANVSHAEAAGATLAALTAWQALVTQAKVKRGDKVLIHAAAGGVGHYAVQIAKHFGAYVIGTGSTVRRDFILGLGADEFIDYTQVKFEEVVKDADVVLDSIYGDHVLRSIEAVKNGGRVITLLTFFEGAIAERAKEKGLFTHRLGVHSDGDDMKKIADLLKDGKLRSLISATYNFADLPKAHLQIATGKTVGKIVVVL